MTYFSLTAGNTAVLAGVSTAPSSAFLQCNGVCRAESSLFLLLSLISVSVAGVFDIFDREKDYLNIKRNAWEYIDICFSSYCKESRWYSAAQGWARENPLLEGWTLSLASNEEVAGDTISPLRTCFLFPLLLWASSKNELMGKSAFIKGCGRFQSRGTYIFPSELAGPLMLPLHPLSPGCGRCWVPSSGGFLPSHPLLWEGFLQTAQPWQPALVSRAHSSNPGYNALDCCPLPPKYLTEESTLGACSWFLLGRGGEEQLLSHCPGKLNFGCCFLPCRSKK